MSDSEAKHDAQQPVLSGECWGVLLSNWMGKLAIHSWDFRRKACLFCIGVMAGLTGAVIPFYPGHYGIFAIYGFTFLALAAVALLGRPSFFTLFLVAFLCLGLWLNVVAHFLFGTALIEPVGDFDQSPAAWDRVLLISAAGMGGVAVAAALCNAIDVQHYQPPSQKVCRSRLFSALGWPVFIVSAAIALALFAFNYYFAILKLGTVPRIYLGAIPTTTIAFTVSWGAMLWLGGLAFWLVVGMGRSPKLPFYVASVEGAIAAMSMSSRAQMILHVAAAFLMYWICAEKLHWRLSLRSWIPVIVTAMVLFVISMAFVSVDRAISFPNSERKVSAILSEISHLFTGRWIGLEGVMAVSSAKGLGPELFRDGLFERGDAGINSIYQKIAHANYERYANFIFLTIPGPVAVLFYSGSYFIVAFGMAIIFCTGYALQRFADRSVRNPMVSSVVGVGFAYLLVQLNYPRTFVIFMLELFVALLLIAAFRLLLFTRLPGLGSGWIKVMEPK